MFNQDIDYQEKEEELLYNVTYKLMHQNGKFYVLQG